MPEVPKKSSIGTRASNLVVCRQDALKYEVSKAIYTNQEGIFHNKLPNISKLTK